MIYRYKGTRFRACHARCAEAFKSDRASGLIYGLNKKPGGGFYMHQEEASMAQGFCAYCSADVRMTSGLNALRRRAAAACKMRGHKMMWPRVSPGQTHQDGACRLCEAQAHINIKPAPNEIDISGSALALNCRYHFTDAEKLILQNAAADVWQEIGGDCLQAIAEEKGIDPDGALMRRSHVIEVVCDANRLEDKVPKELADRIRGLGLYIYTLVRPAFTGRWYGM